MKDDSRIILNHPDVFFTTMICAVSLIALLLALFLFESDWPWTSLFLLGFSVLSFFAIWNREYFRRPKYVEVREGGAHLIFRYSKPRFIPYETMLAINSREGNPATMLGRWDRGGYLEMKNRFTPYFLTYEIAEQMREAYRNKVGRYPPKVGT